MLTEIEWWGGLLFIWAAAFYRIAYPDIVKNGWLARDCISLHLAYLCSAAVLALYFYPLSGVMPTVYLSLLGVGLLALVLSIVWEPDDLETAEGSSFVVDVIIGGVALFGPMIIAFILGAVKSYGLFFG